VTGKLKNSTDKVSNGLLWYSFSDVKQNGNMLETNTYINAVDHVLKSRTIKFQIL